MRVAFSYFLHVLPCRMRARVLVSRLCHASLQCRGKLACRVQPPEQQGDICQLGAFPSFWGRSGVSYGTSNVLLGSIERVSNVRNRILGLCRALPVSFAVRGVETSRLFVSLLFRLGLPLRLCGRCPCQSPDSSVMLHETVFCLTLHALCAMIIMGSPVRISWQPLAYRPIVSYWRLPALSSLFHVFFTGDP